MDTKQKWADLPIGWKFLAIGVAVFGLMALMYNLR